MHITSTDLTSAMALADLLGAGTSARPGSRLEFTIEVPRIIGRRHLNLIRDAARDYHLDYSTVGLRGTLRTRRVRAHTVGPASDLRAFADRVRTLTSPEG